MEGVPFAECFTVDTKWRIKEADKKCRIQIWVKVNFTRSVSLVKGKIERSSVQGTVDYFKNYAKLLRSKFSGVQETGEGASEPGNPNTVGTASPSSLPFILSIVFGVGLVIFFILWLWYWWSAGVWTSYVLELEGRNLELEKIIEEFQNRKPLPPLDVQEKMVEWTAQMDNIIASVEKLRQEMILPNPSN